MEETVRKTTLVGWLNGYADVELETGMRISVAVGIRDSVDREDDSSLVD